MIRSAWRKARNGIFGSDRVQSKAGLARAVKPVVESLENRWMLSAGDLDANFGVGGVVNTGITNFVDTNFEESLVGIQSDGKLIVAGGDGTSILVARFNTDGSPDTNFGTSGVATITAPGAISDARINGMAIDGSDDSIVIAGHADVSGDLDFMVLKLDADGIVDNSFGGNGFVTTDLQTNSSDKARNVAIQSDGKIVAVGFSDNFFGGQNFAVVRYNADGTPDTGFNLTGIAIHDSGNILDDATDVAIRSDGKIAVSGNAFDGVSNQDVAVLLFNDDGSPHTNFGGTGMVLTDLGSFDEAHSVGVQSDDSIVVGGFSDNLGSINFLALRYTDAGILDSGFDSDGIVNVNFGTDSGAFAMAIAGDDKVVLAGVTSDGTAVARLNADGSDDTDFGTNGQAFEDLGGDTEQPFGVLVQSDSNIVVLVDLIGSGNQLLARFEGATGPAELPPVADAGDDDSTTENGSVTLDGSGSSDPNNNIVSYEWDLDNDGNFGEPEDASGASVNFSRDLPGVYTVTLRVTDAANNSSTDSVDITFTDVAPTANAGADQNAVRNQTVSLSGSGSNTAGDAIVTYQWDLDDNGSFETTGQNITTSFGTIGAHNVHLRVVDDDGQVSAVDTVTINVSAAGVQGNDLYIGGSDGADDVDVQFVNNQNQYRVLFNGTVVGTFAATGKILMFGGEGDDDLKVAQDVLLPAEIDGGGGADVIRGGGGNDYLRGGTGDDKIKARGANDILLGEDGSDLLTGGEGRDILIGGSDADKIVGNADDDILIAGRTGHDDDRAALDAIQAEWLSGNSFLTRVSNIHNGGGANGSYTLNADVNVFDDNVKDTLTGGQGSDWFFFNNDGANPDKVTDLNSGDFAEDMDFILE